MFEDFPLIFLLLISSVVSLWSESIVIPLKFWELVLLPKIYLSIYSVGTCIFCYCWVKGSKNFNWILLVVSVIFFYILTYFLPRSINCWQRAIEEYNCNYELAYFSFQFCWLLPHMFFCYLVNTYLGLLCLYCGLTF